MAWRAGQDPGQGELRNTFYLNLGSSLRCENVLCAACPVCQPDTAPGPPLALTLTYIRSALSRTPAAPRHTHTHARPVQRAPAAPDGLETNRGRYEGIWRDSMGV